VGSFFLEVGGWKGCGEGAQAMYTHVNKCKNDKIKGEKKKRTDNQNI
jgi:hypothetical protein